MTNLEIETFLTICWHKSISKAAEALYISQSSLSTRLKKLEQVQVRMVREFLCFKKQILSSRKKAYQLLTTELIHTFVKQIFVYQDKRVEIIFKFEDEMQYLMGKIASLCEGRASA